MPNATIYDGVSIGENTTIHSGVSIRENCKIGRNCIIHNNTTIGSDGFGYAKDENKHWLKIPQTGRVVLEADVEIGANTAIDCASVGETRLKRGAKIDNLVQIGHSCTIDEDALICSNRTSGKLFYRQTRDPYGASGHRRTFEDRRRRGSNRQIRHFARR